MRVAQLDTRNLVFGRLMRPARNRRRSRRRLAVSTAVLLTTAVKTALKTLLMLALVGAVSAAGFFGYRKAMTSTYLTVKQVVFEGTARAPREELLATISESVGRSIFDVDPAVVGRAVQEHPWIQTAQVRRRLPDTLVVSVTEHREVATVLLDHLYLVDVDAAVFKRATPDEVDGLVVITGIERRDYLEHRAEARARIRHVLTALASYQAGARPPLGEINVNAARELTLFLRDGGTALRVGEKLTEQRLRRLDAVWQALGTDAQHARAVYLDHRVQSSRVVVRMPERSNAQGRASEER